jgi:hypothetical protein
MPRYYFNCEGAQNFTDQDGTELESFEEARFQAITNAGEILRDHADRFAEAPRWRLFVVDETGRTVFVIHFSAEEPVL